MRIWDPKRYLAIDGVQQHDIADKVEKRGHTEDSVQERHERQFAPPYERDFLL